MAARHRGSCSRRRPGARKCRSTPCSAAWKVWRSRRLASCPAAAAFLTSDPEYRAPTALLHNLKHNKVLHEHNVILTIVNEDIPGGLWR